MISSFAYIKSQGLSIESTNHDLCMLLDADTVGMFSLKAYSKLTAHTG